VPRITDQMLNCVVYLYKSKKDADAGARRGGTGFLVAVPSKIYPQKSYHYVVTNRHVLEGGARVIRLTTKAGQSDSLEVGQDAWILDPRGHDLAVCHLALAHDLHRFTAISTDIFLTESIISEWGIGVGDDAFMVGRFINHEGKQCNTPTARFGSISMMPQETIRHDGHDEVSFLVEVRSISGYSGSPIFVYLPQERRALGLPNPAEVKLHDQIIKSHANIVKMQEAEHNRALTEIDDDIVRQENRVSDAAIKVCEAKIELATAEIAALFRGPWLLGVNWAYLHHRIPVKDKNTAIPDHTLVVDSNTGMAAAIPAWILQEFLNVDELKHPRDESEELFAKEAAAYGVTLT
jgi:hypothetical protein